MIRNAVGSDCPYLYTICLKTGFSGQDASNMFFDPLMLGQYYAAPYLFYEPQFCFVAEEEGIPKGYIIGTGNTPAFNEWFEKDWLKPVRKRYSKDSYKAKTDFEAQVIETIQRPVVYEDAELRKLCAEYPAHLHIDILSDLQGKGCGKLLLNTFCSALREVGIPGAHLGVGMQNTGAIAFYKKIGFSVLEEHEWGLTMGKKF